VGYDFCSFTVHAVFTCCRVFSYCWSLVFHFGTSNVFHTPGRVMTAHLTNLQLNSVVGVDLFSLSISPNHMLAETIFISFFTNHMATKTCLVTPSPYLIFLHLISLFMCLLLIG
jgi:hypothetical protein